MTDPKGHLCPECGAPRGADNTPSCGCTQRASDALRDARTAEQAAAEDFDPLRIRPYVELEADGSAHPVPPPVPAVEATMPLRPVSAEVPSSDDLRLFEGAHEEGDEDAGDAGDDAAYRSRRRRRTVLLGVGGAFAAVMAAAGLASGLFSYQKPTRETALPDDVRASVPDASPSEASGSPSAGATSLRPAPPAPVVSASPSLSPSPSPSLTSASPSPSRSAGPTATPPTATATGTISSGSDNSRQTAPPVLSRGSNGPEVTELELRLTQLGLYTRKASGHYNEGVEDAVSRYQWARGITDDELGVYGLKTRSRLESETTEP
ncbi:peptidoglycan-binding domain-containing protein [Streptomyces sp. NPDC047043]|uniref:peptidoglycan-binding domain-containing protein n=1 Tax=Streptomyces sp. NPDC047043 TaxID=3154497 RepID=UPI0033C71263